MTTEVHHPQTTFDRRSQQAAQQSDGPDLGGGIVERTQRRAQSLLQAFPGYKGYRAKEDRRDSDRRVRDHLVQEYGRQQARVERVARDLANTHRLMDIGPVDEAAQALRRFSDRINTATYGYGGIFGDRDVDERALDQLRLFDESLLSGVTQLDAPIAALEQAASSNGDLAAPARQARDLVTRLNEQFDTRSRVADTATPAPEQSIRALMTLDSGAGSSPSPAYWLDADEAVSVLGQNGIVDARLDFAAGAASWRLFRFTASPHEQWLFVPAQPGVAMALVSPTGRAGKVSPGATNLTVGETTFAVTATAQGQAEIITPESVSGHRPATGVTLAAPDGGATGVLVDWGNEQQLFTGPGVQPTDLEVFGKPGTGSRQGS